MLWDYLADVFVGSLMAPWDSVASGKNEDSRATMIREVMEKGEMVPQVKSVTNSYYEMIYM
jgi:hypothetical protein